MTVNSIHENIELSHRTAVADNQSTEPNEDARVATSHRHDVSRAGRSRFHLRRHLLRRRAHDGNLLPPHLLREKASPRERGFFRHAGRRAAWRLPAMSALSSD